MKVAVVCSGLGHVQRGIEAWALALAEGLASEKVDVTLFSGAKIQTTDYRLQTVDQRPESENQKAEQTADHRPQTTDYRPENREPATCNLQHSTFPPVAARLVVVPCLKRGDSLVRVWVKIAPGFLWRWGHKSAYALEQKSFGKAMLPILKKSDFDVIHTQDIVLGTFLEAARKRGNHRAPTILAHGTDEPMELLRPFRYLQHLSAYHKELAEKELDVEEHCHFCIPNFVDIQRFKPAKSMEQRGERGEQRAKSEEQRGERGDDREQRKEFNHGIHPSDEHGAGGKHGKDYGRLETTDDRRQTLKHPTSPRTYWSYPQTRRSYGPEGGPEGNNQQPTTSHELGTLRQQLGIPDDAFVIGCAAALKKSHKRIDYLIKEVAKLQTTDHRLQTTDRRPESENQKAENGNGERGEGRENAAETPNLQGVEATTTDVVTGVPTGIGVDNAKEPRTRNHEPGTTNQEQAPGGKNIYLLLAGARTEETDEIEVLATEALGEKCIILCDMPFEQMPDFYKSIDLFVLPAAEEVFGICFLEAMACGVPVVAHASPTLKWIVGNGGWCVDMYEQSFLQKAWCRIRGEYTDKANHARSQVESHFSWDAVFPQFMEMYRQVVSLKFKELKKLKQLKK